MAKLDCPLQLSPVFLPKIWGRGDLSPIFSSDRVRATLHESRETPPGRPNPATPLIGEAWITGGDSRILNGPVAGLTLAEVSEKYGPELHGKAWKDGRFPILAKYLYTSDWLSVQVHPSDEEAQVHDPGERGKCEMWYTVRRERKGEILLGLRPKTSREVLRAACSAAKSRDLLNHIHPKEGEAIFVPPGTVHALGPGLVLFEIQENSDLTYRLDDFGRLGLDGKPRPLHLEKGLAVTRVELPAHSSVPQVKLPEPFGARRYVLACRFFALEVLTVRKSASFEGNPDRVETLSVLEGRGRIEIPDGWMGYQTGDTWMIPPATAKYRLVPRKETKLLKFYVPDLEKDFRQPLLKRRVRAAVISRLLFT